MMIFALLTSLITSLVVCGLLIRFRHMHARVTVDHTHGPQKSHRHPALRIGGVPILGGWFTGLCVLYFFFGFKDYFLFFISSLPVFIFGLTEDFTRKVTPRTRLFAAFFSALIALYFLDVSLHHLDIWIVDNYILSISQVAFVFTVFCIGGVTHAFNIIDGYNGLSGVVSLLILSGLCYVSYQVGDLFLLSTGLTLMASIFGFLLWNYPRGVIFAGDSGAYVMGYLIATMSVIAVSRHPEISVWFPMVLCIYPIFETLFSMYRRKFLQGRSVSYPDRLHLHSLIYQRLVRWGIGSANSQDHIWRNALTSPYLWALTLLTLIPAVIFWHSTTALLIISGIYILIYLSLYRLVIHFRTPRFLILQKSTVKTITSEI